jgi:hypothetical protein
MFNERVGISNASTAFHDWTVEGANWSERTGVAAAIRIRCGRILVNGRDSSQSFRVHGSWIGLLHSKPQID